MEIDQVAKLLPNCFSLKHRKIQNNTASQIFTKNGPLAFLPLSEIETSIVYSIKGKKNINLKYDAATLQAGHSGSYSSFTESVYR